MYTLVTTSGQTLKAYDVVFGCTELHVYCLCNDLETRMPVSVAVGYGKIESLTKDGEKIL